MFELPVETHQKIYEDSLWIRSECYKFYVQQRKMYCNYLELLDLWLVAPYCVECAINDPFAGNRIPDIMPDNWELDLLIHVGGDVLSQTKDILEENPDFCFECKRCRKELRPWDQDEIYVVTYHLEEHYGIPLETPGRKYPNKKMENQILNLYDRECFNCKSHDKQLTIDHILPQCAGGDSAFRNLQPLCVECQNIKGNTHPQVKEVWSKMYFGSYPSDSYEHMFW